MYCRQNEIYVHILPSPTHTHMQGSSAAPISRKVLEFFLDFDLPLYELYGMSESTGPQTLSLYGKWLRLD